MKTLLAKFKCGSVQNFGNNNINANLSAVTNDSEENKTFSVYTPNATLNMHITNPEALDFFEPGKQYICRIEEAEDQK